MAAPCAVDPAGDWSADACRTVVRELTASLDLGAHRDAVTEVIVWMHFSSYALGGRVHAWTGRAYHASPQHLLALLDTFRGVLSEQREQLEDQQRFRVVSLDKLQDTVAQVEHLQASLAEKQVRLEATNAEANGRLQRMVHDQQAAESEREASLSLEAALRTQEAEIAQRKDAVLAELAAAEPAVLDAQAAVSNIKKQHLSEVRSMANPPPAVKQTMESVCMLLGHRVDGWKSVQGIIRRDDFISSVVYLDTQASVPRSVRDALQREYLSRPEFNYDTINRASKACGPLAGWVLAQVHFAAILDRIAPLRAEVASLEDAAHATKGRGAHAAGAVAALEASIATYKGEYAALISETQALKTEMERVQQRVARSVRLLDGLASEKRRWEAARQQFHEHVHTLVGDALLCAAVVVHAGFFDQACREAMWAQWCARLADDGVPFRRALVVTDVLASADTQAAWHACGLPADALSVENAVILERCTRYPLLVDPTGGIVRFLERRWAERRLAVASFRDHGFVKMLESALRFGTPLLLTDADHLDPVVLPVLNRELRRTGGRVLVRVGDQDVDFAPSFRLFLATRSAAADVPAHVFSRVQVVNFTLTRKSLQAQALAEVLRAERPDVEQQRTEVLQRQNELQRRLQHLERALLAALNEAEGHVLDNDAVVSSLETLKGEADDVAQKMAHMDDTIARVRETTRAYEPLAEACSAVYFLLAQLSLLHPFYQFSLPFFQQIFHDGDGAPGEQGGAQKEHSRAVATAASTRPAPPAADPRLDALHRALFLTAFHRAAPTLLHKDHLVLGILLALLYCRVGRRAGLLDGAESAALFEPSPPADARHPLLALLAHAQQTDPAAWAAFVDALAPECAPLPRVGSAPASDDPVRRALVVRVLRPDRTVPALTRLLQAVFETPLLDTRPDSLLLVARTQTPPTTPLVLCAVQGYDASFRIEQLVDSERIACTSVALGSPEARAEADDALATAARVGRWVLLKNGHLASDWLAALAARIAALQPHADFRVFVTCEIGPAVPLSLLSVARVLVHEPPAGLKAALLGTLQALGTRAAPPGPQERERLYFLCAYLHATVLERLRYVPLGWSQAYEFFDADLAAALDVVEYWSAHAAKGRANMDPAQLPWDAMRAQLKGYVYGGKIDRATDRAVLDALVDHLFVPAVFDSDYVLAPDDAVPLLAPPGTRLPHFAAWAAALPDPQPPQWIFLAPATERATATAQGERVLEKLAQLRQLAVREQEVVMPPPGEVVSDDTEVSGELSVALAQVQVWLDRLQDGFVAPAPCAEVPLERFWAREHERAAALRTRTLHDLEELAALCAHTAKRTNENTVLLEHVLQGTVPNAWRQYAMPREATLAAWFDDLFARFAQLRALADPRGTHTVALAHLFHPSAFLTALRQVAAHAMCVGLDALQLRVSLGSTGEDVPGSVVLPEMYLDGGTFTNATLSLNDGASVRVGPSRLAWVLPEAERSPPHSVSLPVFLNSDRDSVLFDACVAASPTLSPELAVLRAVALRVQ
ncbi:hypothetical protein MSPP1_000611 [Malassezia sp. CBS 17886]|nr:hypothetical protein MSPP1_000611 [Malassezia sp. CBS 17886]